MLDFNQQNDAAFRQETLDGLCRKDARYLVPNPLSDGSKAVYDTLALTRRDYKQRVPETYIPNQYDYYRESYASQHRRLQQSFEMYWPGPEPAPMLYCLGARTGGFGRVEDGGQ